MTDLSFIPALAEVHPVGSRVSCNPPPLDTDEDFLWIASNMMDAESVLTQAGFSTEGEPERYTDENGEGGFLSFRRGNVNVIVTTSGHFGHLFLVATALAKQFNLLRKADRIALFQAVLYGKHEAVTRKYDLDFEGAF